MTKLSFLKIIKLEELNILKLHEHYSGRTILIVLPKIELRLSIAKKFTSFEHRSGRHNNKFRYHIFNLFLHVNLNILTQEKFYLAQLQNLIHIIFGTWNFIKAL